MEHDLSFDVLDVSSIISYWEILRPPYVDLILESLPAVT